MDKGIHIYCVTYYSFCPITKREGLEIINYITNSSYKNIKKKLLILYMLNLTDILFTIILLNTGYFIEVNPLIASVLNDNISLLLVKVILPIILLTYICIRIKKATKPQLIKSNNLINVAQLFYASINLFHSFCFALLVFYISF